MNTSNSGVCVCEAGLPHLFFFTVKFGQENKTDGVNLFALTATYKLAGLFPGAQLANDVRWVVFSSGGSSSRD